jgi:TP53 regulating kinase-like protein
MILKDGLIYFIDFGLSEVNSKVEAKAVDLHLLKEAIASKHYQVFNKVWTMIIKYYSMIARDAEAVIDRLKVVESRGRYKKVSS